MSLTPTRKYVITLCDCYEGSQRDEVGLFYERDTHIQCSKCGNTPPEISAQPIPKDHRVELVIYNGLPGQNEGYIEIFCAE